MFLTLCDVLDAKHWRLDSRSLHSSGREGNRVAFANVRPTSFRRTWPPTASLCRLRTGSYRGSVNMMDFKGSLNLQWRNFLNQAWLWWEDRLSQTVYQRSEKPAGVTFENWDLMEISKPSGIAWGKVGSINWLWIEQEEGSRRGWRVKRGSSWAEQKSLVWSGRDGVRTLAVP